MTRANTEQRAKAVSNLWYKNQKRFKYEDVTSFRLKAGIPTDGFNSQKEQSEHYIAVRQEFLELEKLSNYDQLYDSKFIQHIRFRETILDQFPQLRFGFDKIIDEFFYYNKVADDSFVGISITFCNRAYLPDEVSEGGKYIFVGNEATRTHLLDYVKNLPLSFFTENTIRDSSGKLITVSDSKRYSRVENFDTKYLVQHYGKKSIKELQNSYLAHFKKVTLIKRKDMLIAALVSKITGGKMTESNVRKILSRD